MYVILSLYNYDSTKEFHSSKFPFTRIYIFYIFIICNSSLCSWFSPEKWTDIFGTDRLTAWQPERVITFRKVDWKLYPGSMGSSSSKKLHTTCKSPKAATYFRFVFVHCWSSCLLGNKTNQFFWFYCLGYQKLLIIHWNATMLLVKSNVN